MILSEKKRKEIDEGGMKEIEIQRERERERERERKSERERL